MLPKRCIRFHAGRLLGVMLLAGAARTVPARAEESRGLDPRKALTQLGLRMWTMDDGLPSATVNAVLQSRDGYIWLGTFDGLARYDGLRFTVYGRGQGLGSNGIRALCEDAQGSLFVGTNGGGLSRLGREGFSRYARATGLPSDTVRSLLTDRRDGSVWVGTNGGGLARILRGKLEVFPVSESGRVVDGIAQEADGTLWLAAESEGLRRRTPDGRFEAFTSEHHPSLRFANTVAVARDGTVWVGTMGGGVVPVRGGRVEAPPSALAPIRSANVIALLEDREGSLWIGTSGQGLARYADGKLAFLGEAEGVGDLVYSLCEDREGSLWVGTNGAGLGQLRDGSFTSYGPREGLSRALAYTVFEDRGGVLWAGTAGGLDRMKDGRFVPERLPVASPVGVRSLASDAAGALWVGTYGEGVLRLENGRWRVYTTREGLASDNVKAVLVDHAGRVWAATLSGLSVFERGSWRSYRAADGLPRDSLIGLAEDGAGRLWVGTDGGGLCRVRGNGGFDVFTSRQGLASDVVLALFVDAEGVLWVGTNGGLSRLSGERFESVAAPVGLPSGSVNQILEDGNGYLWLGTNRGVSRVARSALLSGGALDIETFDRADGLRSSQCTAPGQPAGTRGGDGRLWFATALGLAAVDPTRLRRDAASPPIVIEEALLDGRTVPAGDRLVVPPGRVRIELRYAVLTFRSPARVPVRFRLQGFDSAWVEAGDRRRADYTGVPPGDYTFLAQTQNAAGAWSAPGAALALHVEPRFFETRGFLAVAALVALGVALLAHDLRVRRLRSREKELTAIVSERTASLRRELSERQRAQAALAESEERFRQLAENIDAVFFMRSVDPPRILYVSPSFERIWGRPREPIYADRAVLLDAIHPADRERVSREIGNPAGYELEFRIVRPNGEVRVIHSRAFSVLGPSGRPERIAGIADDVTRQREVEELRDNLLHMLVHDLKNPLSAILGALEILQSAEGLSAEEQSALRVGQGSGRRLLSMVEAILDVSRLEAGSMPVERERVDVGALVGEVLEMQRPLAEPRRLSLRRDAPAVLPEAFADRSLTARVLQNLVGNAIKFTPAGGEVLVAVAPDGGGCLLRVTVSDSGPGIPEEMRGRLFQKFATGRQAGRGTGLGLSFCRLAVEAQGGTIDTVDEPGRGATFVFTLPLAS